MKHSSLRTLFLLAALACLAPAAPAQSPWAQGQARVKNEELRRELLRMLEEDQAVRAPFTQGRCPDCPAWMANVTAC